MYKRIREGGYRVPTLIKWPGVIKPGTVVNDIGAHEDMLPTLVAAAGDTTATADLLKGRKIGDMTYKVHIDGYDLGPALKGEAAWPRKEFIYWTDDGSVAALRYGKGSRSVAAAIHRPADPAAGQLAHGPL